MNRDEERKDALQQVKAFSVASEFLGVPANIMYGIIGFAISMGATLRSPIVTLVFLLGLGIPAYRIHKDDIDGLKVWVKAIKRGKNSWCGGRSSKRELIIIKKD